jgi:hypothetical protein
MKRLISLSTLISLALLLSCSSASEDPVVVPVVNPGIPSLSFPINEETCLEGTSLNDSQSTLEFRWNASQNANNYQLEIKNLSTNQKQTFNSSGTSYSATLLKSTPYSWNITALGEQGSEPAISASWKFYLAGEGVTNYTPFPSELLSPRSGSTVTPADGNITLSWNGSDVDGDLDYYELYIDTTQGTTYVKQVDAVSSVTESIYAVENNALYSWKIIAVDSNGNKSDSGVYSFRTN